MRETMTLLEREDGIAAPAVGRLSRPPAVGTFLSEGSPAGVLTVLGRRYVLTMPRGARGVVRQVFVDGLAEPVEFGQPLFTLGAALETAEGAAAPATSDAGSKDDEVPEGMVAVRSPTDGIFYRRPSPDQPSYVEEGDRVERGKVLGLVEVMKCFNQLAFGGGPDDPAAARVVRILAEDSGEVKLGQVLFVLDPE